MRKEIIKADLCGRLIHGVKCETTKWQNNGRGKPMSKAVGKLIGYSERTGYEVVFNEEDFAEDFDRVKPILFPSLTQPITVAGYNDGKPFVPLVEAAKAMGIKFAVYSVNGNSIDFVLAKEYVRENTKTRELRKARFWFDIHSSYGFCMSVEGCRTPFLKQLLGIKFFQKYHINFCLEKGEYVEATNEYD